METVKKNIGKGPFIELSKRNKWYIVSIVWAFPIFVFLSLYLFISFTPESDLPSIDELEDPRSNEASIVFSVNKDTLGKYFISNRTKVDYKDLSPHLVNALISTEDERFIDHAGIDARALMRAVSGLAFGSYKGGASTITQQLSKMMFHERSKSKWGRIKQKRAEWIIAARLEKRYTKNEIITMYFNKFDFLNTAVGIHSAAKIYFNKTPKNLLIEESAMLVGMAKNPSIYNPIKFPEKTKKRREVVLSQMKKNGHINQKEYDSIRKLPLGLNFQPESHLTGTAPYFREHVRLKLKSIISANKIKNEYGEPANIYSDGLKIYTSIDTRIQKYAEKAVAKHLKNDLQKTLNGELKNYKNWPFSNGTSSKNIVNRAIKNSDRYKRLKSNGYSKTDIEKNFNTKIKMVVFDWEATNYEKETLMSPKDSILYYKSLLKAGLIAIDPHTGFIKAWVGGADYRHFKYDYASKSRRQVGSTIKPFVYAAALQDGSMEPCSTFPDIKYCIDVPYGALTKQWCPGGQRTYTGDEIPVYYGLANSQNNITAQVIKMNGGKNSRVVSYFKTMGLWNKSIKEVSSLGLGVCDLSVLEQTAAHCIFSNKGNFIEPVSIVRIEDKYGNLLWECNQDIVQVLDSRTAFDVLRMMKGVSGVTNPYTGKTGGTARRIRSNSKPYSFNHIMAGKTGTTQDNSDGWFIGHTPDLVTGVWVGADDKQVHFKTTKNGQGANTALPIWGYFMKAVYKDKGIKINKGDFIPPNPGEPTEIKCEVVSNTLNIWE